MMTRDAKIGLLVGLAFILIVGILLSEHITAATTPDQATLAIAGDRARQATHAPIPLTPVLPKAHVDADPQPRTAVATRDQLDAPPILPPTARIELGQPVAGQIQIIRVDAPQAPNLPADPIADAIAVPASVKQTPNASQPPITQTPAPILAAGSSGSVGTTLIEHPKAPVAGGLAEVAKQAGMELVTADGKPIDPASGSVPANAIPNGASVREYIAQPGDSLSKIASKHFGRSTPATCDAIVALNPSLQKNRNQILVGAKYLIPADAWAGLLRMNDSAATTTPGNTPEALPAIDPKVALTGVASPETVAYVVKPGDSLWRIAEREVGSRSAVAAIKKLNPTSFADGSETVRIGQTLRLPTKQKTA